MLKIYGTYKIPNSMYLHVTIFTLLKNVIFTDQNTQGIYYRKKWLNIGFGAFYLCVIVCQRQGEF